MQTVPVERKISTENRVVRYQNRDAYWVLRVDASCLQTACDVRTSCFTQLFIKPADDTGRSMSCDRFYAVIINVSTECCLFTGRGHFCG